MASRDIDAQIRQRIDAFLKEIGDLVRQSALQAVQDALSVGGSGMRRGPQASSAPAPQAASQRQGKRTGKKRGRRAGGGGGGGGSASPEQILNFLAQNPNARMEKISSAFNADSARLRPVLQTLMDEGRVRKTGERRGTSYHLA
jgi:hypothetical protein